MGKNIYARILEKFGKEAQLGMVQEECAELIKAINKYRRGVYSSNDVIEECVDVEMMLNQMREIFKDDLDLWEQIKLEKLNRALDLVSPI